MIQAVHAVIHTKHVEQVRSFFRDVLEFPFVDAGHGWLIFALPPAELGVHPTESDDHHEIYLMCSDIHDVVAKLTSKGVEFLSPVTDQGWGLLARFRLPGGGPMGIYQPRHATAYKDMAPSTQD